MEECCALIFLLPLKGPQDSPSQSTQRVMGAMFLPPYFQLAVFHASVNLKHIFSIRSETHDWLWKCMLCIFIQESYKRKLESSDLSICTPWRYNQPVALVDTLQPNKLCRGRPAPSHLSPSDSNMSTDGLVAVCKRLPLNHVSFPFPNISPAFNTVLEIMFPK